MAKAIMIQGTMSNVGKSFLTAGILRILKQEGIKAAPFKSQNMALNSFITKEGLEMGRAQVMQAEAAGVEPSVLMNPILLKPTSDVGSQVIVNGKSIGNMPAKEYFEYKKKLVDEVKKAYNTLSKEYDVIVIEGAGSPAEINLKQNDIVNMGMAKIADAKVLLVGDIDRGGVFAQLYGTVSLLEPEEQERIKGLIVNKFRGDKSILEPGIKQLEELCHIKVIGVTPYLQVDVEDEDSLSSRLTEEKEVKPIDIAVISYPRISNFTDFNRLEAIKGVSLRYVKKASKLKNPDLILLPGSKNTMGDLKAIRENGLESAVLKAKKQRSMIMGICGGYQMLGEKIEDPDNTEEGGTMRGMGLLPMTTIFEKEKNRTRMAGKVSKIDGELENLTGSLVEGYEIHMGRSVAYDGKPLLKLQNMITKEEKTDGLVYENVYGTYLHGIFDSGELVQRLLEAIAGKKGISLEQMQIMDYQEYKNLQYDKMAKELRKHLDVNELLDMIKK